MLSKLVDQNAAQKPRAVERVAMVEEFLILITLHEMLNYYTTIFKVPLFTIIREPR